MKELTWVSVPVKELGRGHLGRHMRTEDGGVSVKGVLVAMMHGLHDGHVASQLVIHTGGEHVVQIESCSGDDEFELSLERAGS